MANLKNLGLVAFAVFMGMGTVLEAQQRCDIVSADTTVVGVIKPQLKCLDPKTLNGTTKVIPANTTRIDNDGLALCPGSGGGTGNANIVYVYDNSGSMNATHAFINGTDTTFYFNANGCTPAGTSGIFKIQAWNAAGTATVERTITKLIGNAGCRSPSGDPYNARGRAFRQGLTTQATTAPFSAAGIMSFADSTVSNMSTLGGVPGLLPLNVPANVTAIQAKIYSVAGGGTPYTPALDSAKRWLNTQLTAGNPKKAIIFLSDGEPNDTTYTALIDSTMPPIYGIYLHNDTAGGSKLASLSSRTSGIFYVVPPNDPDSLTKIVAKILGIVNLLFIPDSMVVTNTTNTFTSFSSALTAQNGVAGWKVTLANPVALSPNSNNNITIYTALHESSTGIIRRDTSKFILSTTGPVVSGTTLITGTTLATHCYPKTTLQWLTAAGIRPSFFTNADSLNVRLTLGVSDSGLASPTASPLSTRRTTDLETASLPRTVKGDTFSVFTSLVDMRVRALATAGNVQLEPLATDSIIAKWVHPFDPQDKANDTMAIRPEASGTLVFIDDAGVELADNAFFSTASNRVRVRYRDDNAAGAIAKNNPKKLTFNLQIKRFNMITNAFEVLAVDSETVNLTYNATVGYWEGTTVVNDAAVVRGNGILESYFRGELLAQVKTHNSAGDPDGGIAEAHLILAVPNKNGTLTITDPTGGTVSRITSSLLIKLDDQKYSVQVGTKVMATVTCQGTGDYENVWLFSNGDGTYTIVPLLAKDELNPFVINDGRLSCKDADVIRVDYVDAVYGGTKISVTVSWSDPNSFSLRFASIADSSNISSITETNNIPNNAFLAIVQAPSVTLDKADVIMVVLKTDQGDYDSLPAVETGIFTSVYALRIPFGFGFAGPTPGNGKMDAQLLGFPPAPVQTYGLIRRADGTIAQDTITLLSGLNDATRAYAKDRNGDGKADYVVVLFTQKLTQIPTKLDFIYWNEVLPTNLRTATAANMSISPDSTELRIDLSADPFGMNLTGIKNGKPTVTLPKDVYFGGKVVPLLDSVGPIPMNVVKMPSDMKLIPIGNEFRYNPDTLRVKITESMAASNWDGLLRFAFKPATCDSNAYKLSDPVPTLSYTPVGTPPDSFVVVISNSGTVNTPKVNDCIFLERNGKYRDVPGNLPGLVGIKITGKDAAQRITGLNGYPPVDGIAVTDKLYINANKNDPLDKKVVIVQGDRIVWIEPDGLNVDFTDQTKFTFKDPLDPTLVETRGLTDLKGVNRDKHISAVQIFTQGRYIAHINLYNNLGHFVKSWVQAFGFKGELNNKVRNSADGSRSYLAWNQVDSKGQKAGQGVYIWKIVFDMEQNKKETRIVRTGLIRTP